MPTRTTCSDRANNTQGVPHWPTFDVPDRVDASLDTIVPDNPNKPYDMRELIGKVADEGDFFEIQENYAKNIITAFARIEGRTVGIGPVLSFITKIGKKNLAAELKWLPELDVQNRLKGDYVWFKLGMAF